MPETEQPTSAQTPESPLHSTDFRAFLAHRTEHRNAPAAPAVQQTAETAETPETSDDSAEGADATDAQQEPASGDDAAKKAKTTPIGDRIKTYADRAKASERLVEEQKQRISELEGKLNGGKEPAAKPAETPTPQFAKPKPKLEDFDSLESFTEALTDWKAEERDFKRDAQDKQDKQRKASEKVMNSWKERESAGREKYADYDKVAHADDLPITNAMGAAIMESDLGHELAYYLGSNPKEAARIAKLPVASQIRELGKIEAKLTPDDKAPEDDKPAVASKAPPPPRPARGATPPPAKDPDKIISTSQDFREVLRAREAKLKARLGR